MEHAIHGMLRLFQDASGQALIPGGDLLQVPSRFCHVEKK